MRGYQLELVRETTPEWDELFARVASDVSLSRPPRRALRALALSRVSGRRLRRRRRSASGGSLVGWIAFRIRENRFTWGDALFDPRFPDAVEVALRHVVPSYPRRHDRGVVPAAPALVRRNAREPRLRDPARAAGPLGDVRPVHVAGRRRAHARGSLLHVGRQRPVSEPGVHASCKPFSSVGRMQRT